MLQHSKGSFRTKGDLLVGALIFIALLVVVMVIFNKFGPGALQVIYRTLGYDSPEKIMENGDQLYIEGNYKGARSEYLTIQKKYVDSDLAPVAVLKEALALSAQEAYPKSKEVMKDLIDGRFSKYVSQSTNNQITQYIINLESPDKSWRCCDFGSLGNFWAYGICKTDATDCGRRPYAVP